MQGEITFQQTPEHRKISRVAIARLLQISHRFIPSSLTSGDCSGGIEHIGIVGNRANCGSDVLSGNIVSPETIVIVKGSREVRFAQVRLKFERNFGGCLRFFQTRRTFVVAEPKQLGVQTRCQGISERKLRIPLNRLIDQSKRVGSFVVRIAAPGPVKQLSRAQKKFVGKDVARGMGLQVRFFPRRKICLQRLSDAFG